MSFIASFEGVSSTGELPVIGLTRSTPELTIVLHRMEFYPIEIDPVVLELFRVGFVDSAGNISGAIAPTEDPYVSDIPFVPVILGDMAFPKSFGKFNSTLGRHIQVEWDEPLIFVPDATNEQDDRIPAFNVRHIAGDGVPYSVHFHFDTE